MANDINIQPFEQGSAGDRGRRSRAYEMRRDNDNIKTPKRTLYDMDYAALYHLNNKIKMQVEENGRLIPVPVLYANGEKWAQIRKHGYLRDSSNRVMTPLITLRRTGFENDARFPIPDNSNYVPQYKMYPYRTHNMQYDREDNNTKQSYEYYLVDMPCFIQANYELMVWANSIEHLNDITQAIFATSNHLWGDYYTYRTVINDFSYDTSNPSDSDRIVKATTTLVMDGILREEFEYNETTMMKAYSLKRITVLNEREESDLYINEPLSEPQSRHISSLSQNEMDRKKRRDFRFL